MSPQQKQADFKESMMSKREDAKPDKNKINLFEGIQVRTAWDEKNEKWWFSVVDVVAVLTDSDYQQSRKYWKVLKGRLATEGNQSVTNCYQLKCQPPMAKTISRTLPTLSRFYA